jgi:heme/copper-type cytochrome/quinol oxidase subunit 3
MKGRIFISFTNGIACLAHGRCLLFPQGCLQFPKDTTLLRRGHEHEILPFANTLLLSNAAISLGNAFISLEISCSLLIFFSLFSFILAWTFISLQIKEFRIMGLSINDSVYSCVFFFLTGLHFFHLVVGLLLLSLLFWSCSL